MHDISERRRQEQEIRALAAFPSESPSPVMRINRAGVIIYANDASEPLLAYWGCRRAQTLPLNWRQRIQAVLDKAEPSETEIHAGDKFYSLLLAPIGELSYVNLYARDVTDARVAEAEARQHQTELVHVCRLSTMGEMATGIAHELNQPLSAIVNYANGTRRRLEMGQSSASDLEKPLIQIASQAERASEIIRRLRALVSHQPAHRANVQINDLIKEVLLFVDYEIRRLDVTLETHLGENLPMIHVDLVQIEQVMLNLIRNAMDAVRENEQDRRWIGITSFRSTADTVALKVEDRGHGLTPEVRARLFEPFFSTKNTGMGMGLVISQTIAEDHGGRVKTEQPDQGGASFVLELPAVQPSASALAS
jgi:C4-dicarboxylate-specific signal transduction histidine kinase